MLMTTALVLVLASSACSSSSDDPAGSGGTGQSSSSVGGNATGGAASGGQAAGGGGATGGGSSTGGGGSSPSPDYASCDGTTFFPTGCDKGSCAAAGLSEKVLAEWIDQFGAAHGMTASQIFQVLEVSEVELVEGPVYVWWIINYVYAMDWVRSRQSDSVNLGSYPLSSPPTDSQITAAVALEIHPSQAFDTASVVPMATVESAFASCESDMIIDWCHIDLKPATDKIQVTAIKDLGGNQCMTAVVDVATASVEQCLIQACSQT